jgi:hypothetical protein
VAALVTPPRLWNENVITVPSNDILPARRTVQLGMSVVALHASDADVPRILCAMVIRSRRPPGIGLSYYRRKPPTAGFGWGSLWVRLDKVGIGLEGGEKGSLSDESSDRSETRFVQRLLRLGSAPAGGQIARCLPPCETPCQKGGYERGTLDQDGFRHHQVFR